MLERYVFSIEDHECLLNGSYRRYIKTNRNERHSATLSNLALCKFIQKQTKREEFIVLSGSSYQSKKAQDSRENNISHTGSFLYALEGFCVGGCLDYFMLSDIFSKMMEKENLQRRKTLYEQEERLEREIAKAKRQNLRELSIQLEEQLIAFTKGIESTIKEFIDYPLDHSRLLMLYAQMHHIASQNPDKQLKFTFVHPNKDLLENIHTFFSNPDYIQLKPKNISLHLVQYNGNEEPKEINSVQNGKGGKIDNNYRENTKKLYENYKRQFEVSIDARHNLMQKMKEDILVGKQFIADFIKNRIRTTAEEELIEYRKQRGLRDNYYTFWGRIKGMSKQVKLDAVDKVLNSLKGKTVEYTEQDLAALSDGSLSDLIFKHREREEIQAIHAQLKVLRVAKSREICANFACGRL